MEILSIYLSNTLALAVIVGILVACELKAKDDKKDLKQTEIFFRPIGTLFLFTSCSRCNCATGK